MQTDLTHPSRRALLLGLAASVSAAACGSSSTPTSPTTTDQTWVANVPFSSTDVTVGTGAEAANGSRVVVDYYGWLYSTAAADNKGSLFDTSLQTGRTPFQYVVGSGQVIAGWEQGIPGMKIGGIRRLIIPPALGYGSTGSSDGRIPPNATLVFEVRLNDILVSAT